MFGKCAAVSRSTCTELFLVGTRGLEPCLERLHLFPVGRPLGIDVSPEPVDGGPQPVQTSASCADRILAVGIIGAPRGAFPALEGRIDNFLDPLQGPLQKGPRDRLLHQAQGLLDQDPEGFGPLPGPG